MTCLRFGVDRYNNHRAVRVNWRSFVAGVLAIRTLLFVVSMTALDFLETFSLACLALLSWVPQLPPSTHLPPRFLLHSASFIQGELKRDSWGTCD